MTLFVVYLLVALAVLGAIVVTSLWPCPDWLRRWLGIPPAALALALVLAFVSACAALAPLVDRSSSWAADAVEAYCENLTPDQRLIFGDQVRAKARPHAITVDCDG